MIGRIPGPPIGLFTVDPAQHHLRVRLQLAKSPSADFRVNYVVHRTDGALEPHSQVITVPGDRSIKEVLLPFNALASGLLIGVDVSTEDTSVRVGMAYVTVDLIVARIFSLVALIREYVAFNARAIWPGGTLRLPIEGPGLVKTILGDDPAAGQEWEIVVPAGARWRVMAVIAQLVTDATVQDRFPGVEYTDGTNRVWRGATPTAMGASSTFTHSWGIGVGYEAAQGAQHISRGLPTELILIGGYKIRSSTTDLRAGDNWGPPRVHIEEWLDA